MYLTLYMGTWVTNCFDILQKLFAIPLEVVFIEFGARWLGGMQNDDARSFPKFIKTGAWRIPTCIGKLKRTPRGVWWASGALGAPDVLGEPLGATWSVSDGILAPTGFSWSPKLFLSKEINIESDK